jgi:hypothetical protein
MNYEDVESLLLSSKYKFAKTMPKNPHEYTLIHDWVDVRAFRSVVEYIRQHGYKKTFYGREYTYLDIQGKTYWTMGSPITETILINRAEL